jgi:hypothetical protein
LEEEEVDEGSEVIEVEEEDSEEGTLEVEEVSEVVDEEEASEEVLAMEQHQVGTDDHALETEMVQQLHREMEEVDLVLKEVLDQKEVIE